MLLKLYNIFRYFTGNEEKCHIKTYRNEEKWHIKIYRKKG